MKSIVIDNSQLLISGKAKKAKGHIKKSLGIFDQLFKLHLKENNVKNISITHNKVNLKNNIKTTQINAIKQNIFLNDKAQETISKNIAKNEYIKNEKNYNKLKNLEKTTIDNLLKNFKQLYQLTLKKDSKKILKPNSSQILAKKQVSINNVSQHRDSKIKTTEKLITFPKVQYLKTHNFENKINLYTTKNSVSLNENIKVKEHNHINGKNSQIKYSIIDTKQIIENKTAEKIKNSKIFYTQTKSSKKNLEGKAYILNHKELNKVYFKQLQLNPENLKSEKFSILKIGKNTQINNKTKLKLEHKNIENNQVNNKDLANLKTNFKQKGIIKDKQDLNKSKALDKANLEKTTFKQKDKHTENIKQTNTKLKTLNKEEKITAKSNLEHKTDETNTVNNENLTNFEAPQFIANNNQNTKAEKLNKEEKTSIASKPQTFENNTQKIAIKNNLKENIETSKPKIRANDTVEQYANKAENLNQKNFNDFIDKSNNNIQIEANFLDNNSQKNEIAKQNTPSTNQNININLETHINENTQSLPKQNINISQLVINSKPTGFKKYQKSKISNIKVDKLDHSKKLTKIVKAIENLDNEKVSIKVETNNQNNYKNEKEIANSPNLAFTSTLTKQEKVKNIKISDEQTIESIENVENKETTEKTETKEFQKTSNLKQTIEKIENMKKLAVKHVSLKLVSKDLVLRANLTNQKLNLSMLINQNIYDTFYKDIENIVKESGFEEYSIKIKIQKEAKAVRKDKESFSIRA